MFLFVTGGDGIRSLAAMPIESLGIGENYDHQE